MDDGQHAGGAPQATDIFFLFDRLEELVTRGGRVPFSSRVMVDEEELLNALDQLRLSLPQEIKDARRVLQERQRIIAEAQAEADKIVSVAKERAEYLMREQGLVNEAKARSEEILRQAQEKAKRSMGEVDVYFLRVLGQVESVLEEQLKEIQHAKDFVGL